MQDLEVIQTFRYSYKSTVPKNLSWYEETFPKYDDIRFRSLVRCSPIQFQSILNEIRSHNVFNGFNSQKQFTVDFQLALVLYRLGSNRDGTTVRKISCLFGVGDGGTIDRITSRVFEAILSLESKFLNWPSYEERMALVEKRWTNCHTVLDILMELRLNWKRLQLWTETHIFPETMYLR